MPSNGEDFLFLRRKQLIDFRYRSVGRLLHIIGEPFLIVFGIYVLIAAILAFIGVRKVKKVKAPEQTIAAVKSTKQVLKRG